MSKWIEANMLGGIIIGRINNQWLLNCNIIAGCPRSISLVYDRECIALTCRVTSDLLGHIAGSLRNRLQNEHDATRFSQS